MPSLAKMGPPLPCNTAAVHFCCNLLDIGLFLRRHNQFGLACFSILTHPDFSKLPCPQLLYHLYRVLGYFPSVLIPGPLCFRFYAWTLQFMAQAVCFGCEVNTETSFYFCNGIFDIMQGKLKHLALCVTVGETQ